MERVYEAGAAAGHPEAQYQLAVWKSENDNDAAATDLASRAAEAGHIEAARMLAWLLEKAGNLAGAERWYRQVAASGHDEHLLDLARLRQQADDMTGSLTIYQEAAATALDLLRCLNWYRNTAWQDLCRYGLEPDGTPSEPWQPPPCTTP